MCWLESTTQYGNQITHSPPAFSWLSFVYFKAVPPVWVIRAPDSGYSSPLNPAAVFCDQFLSYNFKPVRRIFLYLVHETLFNLSKNILPLFVLAEKIDWARSESLYVLLDSCQRYYQGIRGILCHVESAYRAIRFLKEKATHEFLEGITRKQLFQWTDFPLFSEALRVSMWTLTSFIPNKAWQQRAASCQNSPRQRTFSLFLKTGRHSALCNISKRLVWSVC